MAMSPPRMARNSRWGRPTSSRPRRRIEPLTATLTSPSRPRTLIAVTVLPEPDSPTMLTISRAPMVNETESTARTGPASVRKVTLKSATSSSGGGSGMPDPWIEPSVDDIDQPVGEHDEKRGVHHRGHDHWQVEVQKRVVGQPANALEAEHHLGEQRAAADQGAEVEAEQRDEADQRSAQSVAHQDLTLLQALGAGRTHIILLQRLDQVGAQDPPVEADIENGQSDPGDHQGLEPADRVLGERLVAQRRHPGEQPSVVIAALGEQVHDLAQPEDRHRDA